MFYYKFGRHFYRNWIFLRGKSVKLDHIFQCFNILLNYHNPPGGCFSSLCPTFSKLDPRQKVHGHFLKVHKNRVTTKSIFIRFCEMWKFVKFIYHFAQYVAMIRKYFRWRFRQKSVYFDCSKQNPMIKNLSFSNKKVTTVFYDMIFVLGHFCWPLTFC